MIDQTMYVTFSEGDVVYYGGTLTECHGTGVILWTNGVRANVMLDDHGPINCRVINLRMTVRP